MANGKAAAEREKNKLTCVQYKRVALDLLSYWYLTGRCLCLAFQHGGVPDPPSTHSQPEVKHTQPAAELVEAEEANPGVSFPVPRPICAHRDVPSCSSAGQGGWQRTCAVLWVPPDADLRIRTKPGSHVCKFCTLSTKSDIAEVKRHGEW